LLREEAEDQADQRPDDGQGPRFAELVDQCLHRIHVLPP
jgi:hypothetical protein